jgi:CheY-like chemotaxis protein
MRPLNCIWFDDSSKYVQDLEEYTVMPLARELNIGFMGVKFDDESGLSEFSKGIHVHLVLVDHNLLGKVTGDEIIRKIREHDHNKDTPIIYYSSNIQAVELQKLVEEFHNIVCIHRNDLPTYLVRFIRKFKS